MALLLFCCSGIIPRLLLIRHSLYVGVVEQHPPPPLTGGQYGKMEPKYHEGGHWQSVLRPQDVVSWEINPWKSVDLLRGSNLWLLAPSAGCLTARPPVICELWCYFRRLTVIYRGRSWGGEKKDDVSHDLINILFDPIKGFDLLGKRGMVQLPVSFPPTSLVRRSSSFDWKCTNRQTDTH